MAFYLFNKNDEIYCEILSEEYMPEMVVCAFGTRDILDRMVRKLGMKSPRIREIRGVQEMLVAMSVNDLKRNPTDGEKHCFLQVHNKTILQLNLINKDLKLVPTNIFYTAHGIIDGRER